MAGLQEVPTDELLLFQDFPPIHNPNSFTSTDITIPISVDSQEKSTKPIEIFQEPDVGTPLEDDTSKQPFIKQIILNNRSLYGQILHSEKSILDNHRRYH